MPRPKGEYTVPNNPAKYGDLAGRTFPSYSKFETERAHEEGFSSIHRRQEIQKLENYQSAKDIFQEGHRGGISQFNEDYQRLYEAERAEEEAEEDEEAFTKVDTMIAKLHLSVTQSKHRDMTYRRALISYLNKKDQDVRADRPFNEYSNAELEGFLYDIDELAD